MKRTIYIAYGSNLNAEQMGYRCPTARVVGAGIVKDYRLLFRGPHRAAVATIEPMPCSKVPVLIWELMPEDEKALDYYEGWPHLYRKEMIEVEVDGEAIAGMAYIMNPGRPLAQPSPYYYSTIRDGYKEAGFDIGILRQATDDSADETYLDADCDDLPSWDDYLD